MIKTLSHYILIEKMLLDINDIINFSLPIHAKLQTLLTESHPEIAKKLYNHNISLQTLDADIVLFNQQGVTPKIAMTQLSQGLALGGTRMTGQNVAAPSAAKAIKRFFYYFNELPPKIQVSLKALRWENYTLENIIDNEIEKGECVETASTHLAMIIQNNIKNEVLNSVPKMTLNELNQLERKYKFSTHKDAIILDIEKDPLLIPKLPAQFINKTLKHIAPSSPEELIILLLNFPPAFYDDLLTQVSLNPPNKHFNALAHSLRVGLFNPEERQALLNTIIKNYQRFSLTKSILFWAIKTNDAAFVQAVLDNYSENERLNAIKLINKHGQTILHQATNNAESLKAILAYFPEEQRLTAINLTDNYGNTVLHHATENLESLKVLLALYPEMARLNTVNITNQRGKTVLHFAADRPELLKILLALYPENQIIDAIKVTDNNGDNVLYHAKDYPESLKTIIESLPEHQRLDVVNMTDKSENTMLHNAIDDPEFLKAILLLLPENQRLEALVLINQYGMTVLSKALDNPDALKTLMSLLPESQRLPALKIMNRYHDPLLHEAIFYPEALTTLLILWPPDQRLEILKIKDWSGASTLHNAIFYPNVLPIILAHLPENQKIEAFKITNQRGATILHKAIYHTEALTTLLALWPENQTLDAIKVADVYGNSVLHEALSAPEALKTILALLPENQRLQALKITDKYGQTILHEGIYTPESLKVILSLLPENRRLEALSIMDPYGQTVLHKITDNPNALTTVLTLLPKNDKQTSLKLTNKYGKTVLHYIQSNPESLNAIQALLSETLSPIKVTIANTDPKNTPAIAQFNEILQIINEKACRLIKEKHNSAGRAAYLLADSLEQNREALLKKGINEETFKLQCLHSIRIARQILETHRGWKRVFADILLAITTLGAGLILIEGINIIHRKVTGKYVFFRTDSAKKLDKMEYAIEAIGASAP